MVNRRSARRSRRQRNPQTTRRLGRMITRKTQGLASVPTVDPPQFVAAPWWPMTVNMAFIKDESLFPSDLYDIAMKQLNWDGYKKGTGTDVISLPVEMRVVSVRAWGLARKPLQLTVYDLAGTSNHILAEINDYGTAVNYSRVGWRYGTITNFDTLSQTDSTTTLFHISGASSDQHVLCYVQILLRTSNAQKPVVFSLQDKAKLCLEDMVI